VNTVLQRARRRPMCGRCQIHEKTNGYRTRPLEIGGCWPRLNHDRVLQWDPKYGTVGLQWRANRRTWTKDGSHCRNPTAKNLWFDHVCNHVTVPPTGSYNQIYLNLHPDRDAVPFPSPPSPAFSTVRPKVGRSYWKLMTFNTYENVWPNTPAEKSIRDL